MLEQPIRHKRIMRLIRDHHDLNIPSTITFLLFAPDVLSKSNNIINHDLIFPTSNEQILHNPTTISPPTLRRAQRLIIRILLRVSHKLFDQRSSAVVAHISFVAFLVNESAFVENVIQGERTITPQNLLPSGTGSWGRARVPGVDGADVLEGPSRGWHPLSRRLLRCSRMKA